MHALYGKYILFNVTQEGTIYFEPMTFLKISSRPKRGAGY